FLILDTNKGDCSGEVHLNGEDIHKQPVILKHHHHERFGIGTGVKVPLEEFVPAPDSFASAAGVQMGRKIVYEAIPDEIVREEGPLAGLNTEKEIRYGVEKVSWGHHLRGGMAIGNPLSPKTVVDGNLQVLETTGYYVCNAATLPENRGDFIAGGLYV